MNKNNLVDQCCEVYEMTLPQFAKKYELSESTLKQWRSNLPSYGKLLMEKMIENHELIRDKDAKAELLARLKKLLEEFDSKS